MSRQSLWIFKFSGMNKSIRTKLYFFLLSFFAVAAARAQNPEYYQIRVYHLANEQQQQVVENFLQNAFLPAAHKAGVAKVGVFKPVDNDTSADRRIFVFMPFKSQADLFKLQGQLEKDQAYATAGKAYNDAPFDNIPYKRMETIVLEAFPDMPKFQAPALTGPMGDRIYELRSYESATEKIYANKVEMFNKGGEIKIFKRLNFNAVFYGKVLVGSHMPNLMYLTTFENKPARDEHWKSFSSDTAWKQLSAMPQYQKNVSHQDIIFLHPAAYSDI